MLAVDPPQHTRLRKLVTKAFTTGAVAALRPFIEQVTDALLDRWPTAGQVDVVAELAMPLPVTVICELLGVLTADRADVRRWSADMFAAGQPERIDAASHAMAAFMTDLIAAKRDRPGNALLDQLIASRDGEDRLSEDELVALAVLLLVAGHETTTNFIGNALLALLRPPTERPSDQLSDQLSERPSDRPSEQFSSRPSERLSDLERLCREPDTLVPRALDELLRHGSPVSTATFRYTKEAITLGGTEIPMRRSGAGGDRRRQPRPRPLPRTRPARPRTGGRHRAPQLRPRHPPVRRRPAGQSGGGNRPPEGSDPLPGSPARRTPRATGPASHPPGTRADDTPRPHLDE